MDIEIIEESAAILTSYAQIPIQFAVDRVLDVEVNPSGRISMKERTLEHPYVKDYDAVDGEGPEAWSGQFDLANWKFFAAFLSGNRVGGAAVAINTEGLTMLENRTDLAILWDIRVLPHVRGHGVGSALFRAAERCAIAEGCSELRVETQNINVPACRFYTKHGCTLRTVNRNAYLKLPNEIQLLWYKQLPRIAAR